MGSLSKHIESSTREVVNSDSDQAPNSMKREIQEEECATVRKKQRTEGDEQVNRRPIDTANATKKREGFESFTEMDVLSGRGGGTNLHPGNRHYRDLILSHRRMYDLASKSKKPGVSRNIVQLIRDKGGRFLRKEKDGGYYDIGDEAAREKTSQALRHRTFEMRNKEDPRRRKDKRTNGLSSQVDGGSLPPVLFSSGKGGFQAASMDNSFTNRLDFSQNNQGLDKLFSQNAQSLESQKRQEQLYQEALTRQRQMNVGVDPRHQDPAYLKALVALKQREAALDFDKALHDVQMRRHLSLTSQVDLSPFSSSNNPLLRGGTLSLLNLPQQHGGDPSLLLSSMASRMAPASQSNTILKRDLYDLKRPSPSFLPGGS